MRLLPLSIRPLLILLVIFLAACADAIVALPRPAPSPTAMVTSTPTPSSSPSLTPTHTSTPTPEPPPADRYAGWAVVAYPGVSQAKMEAMLRRLKDAGANVVWIGHNNPGEAEAGKPEPGLSYAVYAAAQNPADPQHATALEMIEAQHRLLRAARVVGLPAVFPIGYQIHMGQAWQYAHPRQMRHDAAGQWLNLYNGGVSASLYAAEYRRDIRTYYEWVRQEFVMPYRDVILMLNLADEPLGGDYSQPAEIEFQARTGFTFAEASPAQVGAFQDRVIVDYALWSAQQWLALAPDVRVTISFCGAQGRWSYRMPNVEALFRETPPNFVPTFDAYVHDHLPWKPITAAEVGSLTLFARTLGDYSARWNRDFWLWSAGNRWGLAGFSPEPGGVSDALANGYLLTLATRSTGGQLRGLAVWNYNVNDQGLYGDADPAPYEREAMFARVSAAFGDWRRLMAAPGGQATMLVLLTDAVVHHHLGTTRNAVLDSPINFDHLRPLAYADTPLAVAGSLPEDLSSLSSVLVLDPTPEMLSTEDQERLRAFAASGGHVIATQAVLDSVLAEADTATLIPADPLTMSADEWARLFPSSRVLRVSSPGVTLVYSLDAQPFSLLDGGPWRLYDRRGDLRPDSLELRAHEFALSP